MFQPDYRMMALVMQNRRPPRLPLYEHIISTTIMETIFGVQFAGLHHGGDLELRDFFRHYCGPSWALPTSFCTCAWTIQWDHVDSTFLTHSHILFPRESFRHSDNGNIMFGIFILLSVFSYPSYFTLNNIIIKLWDNSSLINRN